MFNATNFTFPTRIARITSILLLGLAFTACGGSSGSDDDGSPTPSPTSAPTPTPVVGEVTIPDSYRFENNDGESTVSYTGQTKRHILINDLTQTLLDEDIASDTNSDRDEVIKSLNFYYQFDGDTSDSTTSLFTLEGESLIADDASPASSFTYGQISSGKDLQGKIAGNDPALLDGGFIGWSEGLGDSPTPDDLINYWFGKFADSVSDGVLGFAPVVNDEQTGVTLASFETPYYVDNNGLDYRQLIQKFLSVAVAFSQGTADYLSIDFGSAENLALEDGKPYTVGQHDFDEAFGYFGAARDYDAYTDAELKDPSYRDTNNDDAIDIRAEFNFGHSTNCAKRDLGSADGAKTDFTQDAFDAFLEGRAVLASAGNSGELSSERREQLDDAIERAALTWEKCIAATAVHYINDMRAHLDPDSEETVFSKDLPAFLTLDDYFTYAKHFSEMKGFALGLQFSPFSPFRNIDSASNMADLASVLSKMGDSPFMPDTDATVADSDARKAYSDSLLEARDLLQDAYDFDPLNAMGW